MPRAPATLQVAPALPFVPRGLNREQAAAYVGVGTTLFDAMVAEGKMPKPFCVRARRIWDRHRLDLAIDRLATEDDAADRWDDVG